MGQQLSCLKNPPSPTHPGDGPNTTVTQGGAFKAPTGQLCQVFVIHAGGEKEESFVTCLCAEFQRSYPALEVVAGGECSLREGTDDEAITAAVEDAFVVVLVLSKEFISSPGPLEELQLLLERQQQGSPAALLPVFHGTSRGDVDKQMAAYQKAEVGTREWQWAKDLSVLTGTASTDLVEQATGDTLPVALEVVDATVKLLAGMAGVEVPFLEPAAVPDIPIGLEGQQGAMNKGRVMQLLVERGRSGSSRMVLLHGMGGIGKTTVANAVFNELEQGTFDHRFFLQLNPIMKEFDVLLVQKQLCRVWYASDERTSDRGRVRIAEDLEGQRVLLVVDNVWGKQLERLLPKDFMQLLGEGSMVLVTSQEQGAADGVGGTQAVAEVGMERMPQDLSVELFCKYAFPGLSPAPRSWVEHVEQSQWASQILAVLKMCAGLPMALELVGRYFAASDDKGAFHNCCQEACSKQKAGCDEAERMLFGAVQMSWGVLEPEEQEALLDIALMLKGQPWDLVQQLYQPSILRRLCGFGLVKQQGSWINGANPPKTIKVASVHDAVAFFCSGADATGGPPLRKAASTRSEMTQAVSSSLKGLSLRGQEVDEHVFRLAAECSSLRVLLMAHHELQFYQYGRWEASKVPLVLSLPQLRCLQLDSLEFPSRTLHLQGMPNLLALDVRSCRQLQVLSLSSCPKVKVAQVARCQRLEIVDVGGAGSLQKLLVAGCGELKGLRGLKHLCGLTSLEVGGGAHLAQLDLGGLQALRDLNVSGRLYNLHLGSLKALRALEIRGTHDVPRLTGPSELKGAAWEKVVRLPELRALTSLVISCPNRRCRDALDLTGAAALQVLGLWWGEWYEVMGLGRLGALRQWTIGPASEAQLPAALTADMLIADLKNRGVRCPT